MLKGLPAHRSTPGIVLGIMAVVIASGGYALASGGGTITACVHHGTGALYVKHKCEKSDKKLTWNQVGPQGSTGAGGPMGPAGPISPSSGFTSYNASQVAINNSGNTTVDSVVVPAGTYIVTAKTVGAISPPGAIDKTLCVLVDPSGTTVDTTQSNVDSATIALNAMTLVGPVTTTGGTITLRCQSVAGNNTHMDNSHIAAIKLGVVTGT